MKAAAFLLLGLLPWAVLAESDPWSMLQDRFRPGTAAEFRYEETRTLDLMAAPQRAQGYLLSAADGTLVKLQLAPHRIIMAISGDRMYYYDAAQGQRRSAPLSYAGDALEQIAVFRAILQGRAGELRSRYDLIADRHGDLWNLRLTARSKIDGTGLESIAISGRADVGKRQVSIRQADGDATEYSLERTGEGGGLEFSVQRLLQEAAGE